MVCDGIYSEGVSERVLRGKGTFSRSKCDCIVREEGFG